MNHSNWKIFEWTDQEENLMRQIHEKDNQKDWKTLWNESCEETIIVSRTDLHVISNKKKDDRMISQWCTDRTFWNQQNSETNLQKLLLFTNETENEKTYSTMQVISEKQIKTTQIIWKITAVESSKWIMIVNYNKFYHQIIKIQKINHWIWVWFNYDYDE